MIIILLLLLLIKDMQIFVNEALHCFIFFFLVIFLVRMRLTLKIIFLSELIIVNRILIVSIVINKIIIVCC